MARFTGVILSLSLQGGPAVFAADPPGIFGPDFRKHPPPCDIWMFVLVRYSTGHRGLLVGVLRVKAKVLSSLLPYTGVISLVWEYNVRGGDIR